MIYDSVSKCDIDLRTDFYKNIVLSGKHENSFSRNLVCDRCRTFYRNKTLHLNCREMSTSKPTTVLLSKVKTRFSHCFPKSMFTFYNYRWYEYGARYGIPPKTGALLAAPPYSFSGHYRVGEQTVHGVERCFHPCFSLLLRLSVDF